MEELKILMVKHGDNKFYNTFLDVILFGGNQKKKNLMVIFIIKKKKIHWLFDLEDFF